MATGVEASGAYFEILLANERIIDSLQNLSSVSVE
jgi:hypothetical protein